jgi:RNA 2',3'-cyclic 3'-phosphodiesterase
MPSRARLFVALDLPDDVRSAIVGWQEAQLASFPSLRPVRPEALHVTLCFLGWREMDDIDPIASAATGAAAEASGLSLGAPVWLPRRRPRVLALEVGDPGGACATLQAAVASTLVEGAFFEQEKRPFFPHVTVARVRGGTPRALGREELDAPPALAFAGAAVTLYRSRPTAGGATYEALARAEL